MLRSDHLCYLFIALDERLSSQHRSSKLQRRRYVSQRVFSLRATSTAPSRAPARVPIVSLTTLAQTVLFCQRSQEGGTEGSVCILYTLKGKRVFFLSCRNFKLACHHFLQKRAGLFSASFPGAPQQANNWRGRGHRHDRGAGHRNSASGPNLCGFSALRNDRHLPDDL